MILSSRRIFTFKFLLPPIFSEVVGMQNKNYSFASFSEETETKISTFKVEYNCIN